MEVTKEQFGIEITKLLKERKLTQKALASHLGITPAAVSYMLKDNKLHPSPAHFNGIMSFLQATPQQISRLRTLWGATQKSGQIPEDPKLDFFSIRCAKNIKIEEVAAATGIDPDRLRDLENKTDAEPTPEELSLLKGFYGPDLSPLDNELEGNSSLAAVAEELHEELSRGEKNLPILSLDVLARVAKAGSLENFLGNLPFNSAPVEIDKRHFDRAKAVLICDAEEIHFGFKGNLQLVLAEYDPRSSDPLHVGRGKRGGVALWQKMRRTWKYCGAEFPVPRMSNSWSLPVLEMRFVAEPFVKNLTRKKK